MDDVTTLLREMRPHQGPAMHVNRVWRPALPSAVCACAVVKPSSRQLSGMPGLHLGPVSFGAAYPVSEMSGPVGIPLMA